MYVLGVNGWWERGHDAAACLVKDGVLLSMGEEERFIRKKRAYDSLPICAISFCLRAAGISLADVDVIAYGWDKPLQYEARGRRWQWSDRDVIRAMCPSDLHPCADEDLPELVWVPHHRAHAASAFYVSGFSEAGILVVDGAGETISTTLAYGSKSGIEIISEADSWSSLGFMYEAASEFLGLGADNPGKTMGLASYGEALYPIAIETALRKPVEIPRLNPYRGLSRGSTLDQTQEVRDAWMRFFVAEAGLPRIRPHKEFDGRGVRSLTRRAMEGANLARSVQAALEAAVCELARAVVQETGVSDLVLAGGVALNCAANGKIARLPEVADVFVQPAAGDAGASLGAALDVCSSIGKMNATEMEHAFFGFESSNTEVEELLRSLKIPYEILTDEELVELVASLLCRDLIVGWFRGRAEVGPRALGHRSILANPVREATRDAVNKIKGREAWRPLAPSVCREDYEEYFGGYTKPATFMLVAAEATPQCQRAARGIVHIDGTSRPQAVSATSNAVFHALIRQFGERTGVPMLLNTSFNTCGEPIVNHPIDAIRTFWSTGIDALIIGNTISFKSGFRLS